MNIPEQAIESAARSLYARHAHNNVLGAGWDELPQLSVAYWRGQARAALEAAAPLIAAQALRDAAKVWGDTTWQDVWAMDDVDDDVTAVQSTVRWLLERATDLEAPND